MGFPADFYSTAAQIIVALFVLAAIEFRFLVTKHDGETDLATASNTPIFVGFGLVFTFSIGLGAALVSLYEQAATWQRDTAIVGAIVTQLVMVLSLFLFYRLLPTVKRGIERFPQRTQAEAEEAVRALEANNEALYAALSQRNERLMEARLRLQKAEMWTLRLLNGVVYIVPYLVPVYALVALATDAL
jgi:hypothetical protein